MRLSEVTMPNYVKINDPVLNKELVLYLPNLTYMEYFKDLKELYLHFVNDYTLKLEQADEVYNKLLKIIDG